MKFGKNGFTLIELLLVVVIIGLMLVVIVPRAWRANIDTKYALIRQNCSELASFANQWAEEQIEASVEKYTEATKFNYLYSLADNSGSLQTSPPLPMSEWIARQGHANNWIESNALVGIPGRCSGDSNVSTANDPPECSVEAIIAPEKLPRNPFNGASVFVAANDPEDSGFVTPGAIAFGCANDPVGGGNFAYFAFVFQGTDAISVNLGLNDTDVVHAGQESQTITGLRNGVYVARLGRR
ncbi:MAG: prepilin-type N-terminal cleavage/methylation domain-containing protein [Pseudomonadota bacterium]|nr:prepilin-type N-terminal cleavage/methylation domain-containing protein [Pseudomonadota bacterium]